MIPHTILYIEDHDINVQLVKRMLKFMPYTILAAANGTQGLAMAQQYRPDLILMDINLPDIDGLNLTALIKTYDTLREIPIVAFTADSSYATYQRCLDVGCAGYLNKPISKVQLFKVLQQHLPDPLPQAL